MEGFLENLQASLDADGGGAIYLSCGDWKVALILPKPRSKEKIHLILSTDGRTVLAHVLELPTNYEKFCVRHGGYGDYGPYDTIVAEGDTAKLRLDDQWLEVVLLGTDRNPLWEVACEPLDPEMPNQYRLHIACYDDTGKRCTTYAFQVTFQWDEDANLWLLKNVLTTPEDI